jgi:hypothetical protein
MNVACGFHFERSAEAGLLVFNAIKLLDTSTDARLALWEDVAHVGFEYK